MSHYDDVKAFHLKFGVPSDVGSPGPHLPPADVLEYRENFLEEELDEFKESWRAGNLPDSLDALIDLVYVAYGTALLMGVSPQCWHELWLDVQRANMAKERATSAADSRSKRAHSLDVVKPEGWVPPNGAAIVERHQRRWK